MQHASHDAARHARDMRPAAAAPTARLKSLCSATALPSAVIAAADGVGGRRTRQRGCFSTRLA